MIGSFAPQEDMLFKVLFISLIFYANAHARCLRSNATWQMWLSLDRLHVCILFTDLQHYKLLLSRRVLESICWLSTFAKTVKTNRVLMSATHLKNPRLWVLYLSVPIFSLPLVFCFSEHTQWYEVKSLVDSFTQITVFCHPNLELPPLFTRVWERSNYNPGQTSLGQYCKYFFYVSLLLLTKDTILFYKDGQRKGQVF